MKKDEIFDLVVKAFGVYLLVLAIIALPKMLAGLYIVAICLVKGISITGSNGQQVGAAVKATYLLSNLGGAFLFSLYIIASVNFLRSGSWVKMLMGKTAQPNIEQPSSEPAPSNPQP